MPLKLVRSPNFKGMIQSLDEAADEFLNDLGNQATEEHEKIVANWSDKPTFKHTIKKKGFGIRRLELEVTGNPDAVQHWWWVENGTGSRGGGQAYDINPKKKGGVLTITLGYKPKTTPKGGYGGPGAASGPTIFRRRVKQHKGITPRNNIPKVRKRVLKWAAGKYARIASKKLFRR